MVRGDRTDGADAGIGLPVNGCRSPDGDRPGDDIAVLCRVYLQCGPCPGLSNCRVRLVLADELGMTRPLYCPRRVVAA